MPISRHPRIVGFDVPPLKETVDVVRDAPLVAMLDMVPVPSWTDAFLLETASIKGPLASALLSLEGDRILFFASAQGSRACCDSVRTLVEKVNARMAAGGGPRPSPVREPQRVKAGLRHVLVVEDDEALREVACDVLNVAGWLTTPAASVPQALEALDDGVFDAVLTDIDLVERGDGLALAHTVRKSWPRMALVVVTGRHAEGALEVPEGAIFLAKPYQRRQLLAVLDLLTGPV